MSADLFRILEFDKVVALLAGFTASAPGHALALDLAPLADSDAVSASLSATEEMAAFLDESGALPLGGNRDLLPLLAQLHAEGTWLPALALLDVLAALEAAEACRRVLSHRATAPGLAALASGLVPKRELRDELRASIGQRGEILDRASSDLAEIRRTLQTLRSRIRCLLEGMLSSEKFAGVFQDQPLTERNGRYVVPVRADHRGRVKGFVHDESASGQTLFVEPAPVLELNNELQHLLREEQREEERILRRLAAVVRRCAPELIENQRILARLDLLAAVARYARLCDAIAPQLAKAPLLELHAARHPLLLLQADGRRREAPVVAIDLLLGEACEALVVSGPNTGGKTVALKTAGLLLLMVRCGLPIPCRYDSRIHLFGRIFADIGDEQSIEANLSTFSGHLLRLKAILAEADGDSLVLLDEVGTGTDPSEGGALALAVLDTLAERGARAMVTTHLNLVKGYAQLRGGVVNAAVEFDRETLAPAYRLHYGIPGASNAFTIARRLGLDEALLQRAESYIGGGEREGLQVVAELNLLTQQVAEERETLQHLHAEAQRERDKRKRLLVELEGERQALLDRASRRADQLVREAERRLKTIFSEVEGEHLDARSRARLAGEVRAVRDDAASVRRIEPELAPRPPKEVKIGEVLRIPELQSEGEVVRIEGDEVELDCAGKKLRLPLARLAPFAPRRFAGKRTTKVRGTTSERPISTKLLLVGKRADEALHLLDRALDDALLHGLAEIEVIHGAGEGILRRSVREFLAKHKGIRGFHPADPGHGGDNVTVVELGG